MKRLLTAIGEHGEQTKYRIYYIDENYHPATETIPENYRPDLQRIMNEALRIAEEETGEKCWVFELKLGTNQEVNRYFYYSVICYPESFPDQSARTVLLDLDGKPIAPELRVFNDEEEAYEYIHRLIEKQTDSDRARFFRG